MSGKTPKTKPESTESKTFSSIEEVNAHYFPTNVRPQLKDGQQRAMELAEKILRDIGKTLR